MYELHVRHTLTSYTGILDDWIEKSKNLLDGKNAYEAILEQFYNQLAPIAGRKPYMASPGNHEVACEVSYMSRKCM
jgi:hypothetical protein